MARLIRSLALAAALAGCATTPTPYQSYRSHSQGGIHGGYSDQQVGAGDFLVRFHGNSMTSRDRVERYMLYHAAELTLKEGYDWFLVTDRDTRHNVRTIVEPNPLYRPDFGPGYEGWRPNWNLYIDGRWHRWTDWTGGPSSTGQFDIRRIEAFEVTAEIQMRKGALPAGDAKAIDAHKVVVDLAPIIERPKS